MKRYRFRLEALLRLRRLSEKDALRDLATVQAELDRVDVRIATLERNRLQLFAALEPGVGSALDAAGMLLTMEQLDALERERERVGRQRARIRLAQDEARKKLTRHRADRTVVESLDEEARTAHRAAIEDEERKTMDEVAGTRFQRGRVAEDPKGEGPFGR